MGNERDVAGVSQERRRGAQVAPVSGVGCYSTVSHSRLHLAVRIGFPGGRGGRRDAGYLRVGVVGLSQ